MIIVKTIIFLVNTFYFIFHLGPLIYVHNYIQTSKSKNQLINVMAQYQQ